ncbi:MAG: phosphoribosylamine--glycine ligase [Acidimicrobiia bacterium]
MAGVSASSLSVMVVGSGGREHAICWALATDASVEKVVAVPGNPGIASLQKTECIEAKISDFATLVDIAEAKRVDVTVVGPELPLCEGIADYFRASGQKLFGPTMAAARLESSKAFAKQLMIREGVPTPKARIFDGFGDLEDAIHHIAKSEPPWVIKADGLAGGKGVLVTTDEQEAIEWARACLSGEKFGSSGSKILIEEYSPGKEASVLVVTDGKNLLPLPVARDYKRLLDEDQGPNTGGMGAFSPVPEVDDSLLDQIMDTIFEPVLAAVRKECEPYVGVLYGGLVLSEEGPMVLEFNVRLGDPEAQAVLPRLGPQLATVLDATLSGDLDRVSIHPAHNAAVTVVLAAQGYPERPRTEDPIFGLDEASQHEGVTVFHAGTALSGGQLLTAGGRVLDVSAVGNDLREARKTAYEALSSIYFEGMQYRTDIAQD